MSKHFFTAVAGSLLASLIAIQTMATDLRIGVESHNSPICYAVRDTIGVSVVDLTGPIRSLKLTFALAENSQAFLDVIPGTFMTSCNWEYLGWKIDRTTTIANSPSYGPVETGILEINAAASITSSHLPVCLQGSGEQQLVQIVVAHATSKFAINSRCSFVPFRFYWRNCRDNSLVGATGDTVFTAMNVSEPNEPSGINPPGFVFPGYGAPGSSCGTIGGTTFVPSLSARNGGFELICSESLYVCPGDINDNGIPAEISDVVMLTNYFTMGMYAFGNHQDFSVAMSDVNSDGTVLTIADLVYLMRLALGDFGP
jgi:hypothetical protein